MVCLVQIRGIVAVDNAFISTPAVLRGRNASTRHHVQHLDQRNRGDNLLGVMVAELA